jgi:hypothetical protein
VTSLLLIAFFIALVLAGGALTVLAGWSSNNPESKPRAHFVHAVWLLFLGLLLACDGTLFWVGSHGR